MVCVDVFNPEDITTRQITLDKYEATPYREELLYTIVDDDEDECVQNLVVYSDDGPWHLDSSDASTIRDHIFSESWEGDRTLDAVFYQDRIAAVKICDAFIPLSSDGYMCIYFTLGRLFEAGNFPE